MKNDEFWDYDRQVDLEGFSTKHLYDTLSKQSRSVTQSIGQHKDKVKQMYQRIANQTESLKGKCQYCVGETLSSEDRNLFFRIRLKMEICFSKNAALFFCLVLM